MAAAASSMLLGYLNGVVRLAVMSF
jgi:hypothetical protein